MKAVICTKYGSPDVLRIKEIEKPVPEGKEVLIKIYASTVNRTDIALLKAKPFFVRLITGMFKPKFPVIGTDFAGIIEAVGDNVSSFKIGDRVFGINENGFGSHAQYMAKSEDRALTTIPVNITYEEAAASTEGAHYAYNFINKLKLQKGERVLVNGATGAIGSAAVQLLKFFGADITAVCSTENLEMVKNLGASRVIDYLKEDFTSEDYKYNYIFDTVGKSSFCKCRPVLYPGGIYLSSELGFMYQNLFLPLITRYFGSKKVIFPVPLNSRKSLLLIKKLIAEGSFKSVIDRNYSLEQIIEAYRYVEKGQKTGNVVIRVEHKNGN